MAKTTSLKIPQSYTVLRNEVQHILVQGQAALEALRLQYYWETGNLLLHYLQERKAGHGEAKKLIMRLCDDLNLDRSNLYRTLQFAQAYPNGKVGTCRLLTWSHYRALLGVQDERARKVLTQETEREGWTVRELKRNIEKQCGPEKKKVAIKKTKSLLVEPERKQTGTYKLGWLQTVGEKKELVVSLGFEIYEDLSKKRGKLKEGDTIVWKNNSWARGGDEEAIYYYNARVERVVDGDTLLVHIHFANGTRTRRYLRLRGLDAAPLKESAGQRAKDWLARQIKKHPQVLVRTHLTDKYDRYIADVWAGDTYINNALLDAGHAVRAY